ncbi:MAG TPA: type II toxin-antitoxin system RelE/ParE family toxin [Flavipsychrobacter sp.]|nr:type II toxin-antitoxin system RelE/ParE family toxin [Flavipsychrobacter sp.]
MSCNLIIKEEARQDMLQAYLYYEQERNGLGDLFLTMLEDRFTAISQHPEFYSFIDERKILRDVTLYIFPFVIVFEKLNSDVIVYAICSTHRGPKSY